MSLRLKLAILSAVLVAVAVGVVTLSSSRLIGDRLHEEVDRSLMETASQADNLVGVRNRPIARRPELQRGLELGPVGLVLLSDTGEVQTALGESVDSITEADRETARAAAETRRDGETSTGVFSTRATELGDVRTLTVPVPGTGALVVERSLDEVRSVTADLRRRSALLGGLVVVAAAAIGWWLTRRATGPLHRLRVATGELAATGTISSPLPKAGPDEVGQLAESFSTMVTRLDASRAQQRALVEDAGHELRTPLTSLRLNLEVLARYPNLPESERAPLLADLDAEVTELSRLTNEIVELATDQRDRSAPERLEPARLAERVARRARRRTGREVAVNAEAGTPAVMGSAMQLERAMTNLVDNALKFSAEDAAPPSLTIRRLDADSLAIEVTDHGPGIPEADLPRVFDRFHRSEAARSAPGSGLGLAIVESIAREAGGSTWARNNPGGGATVGFSVRAVPADDTPQVEGSGND